MVGSALLHAGHVLAKRGDSSVTVFSRCCEREEDRKNVSDVWRKKAVSDGSYRDALRDRRFTIVDLKVHWGGPQVFLNVLESWVHFLQLITQGKLIRVCGPMGSTRLSVNSKK